MISRFPEWHPANNNSFLSDPLEFNTLHPEAAKQVIVSVGIDRSALRVVKPF